MLTFLIVSGAVLAFVSSIAWLIILALSDANVKLIFKSKYGKKLDTLAGQVVWITGASSGIGEYIAYQLAEVGCKLVLSARRQDELERVKKACLNSAKCKVSEENILILPLDVTDYDSHKKAVQQVLEYFNKIDILLNNAGKSQRVKWMETELDVDRELFEINVLGPVSLTQEVLPHMLERKRGQIAVMSSMAGFVGVPLSRSYTGTKHAVNGYFKSLRVEMAEHNIDVTLICPGPVYSGLFSHLATGQKGKDDSKEMREGEKRMSTERCAYLSCVAMANKDYMAWIIQQPLLLFVYVLHYMPDLGTWIYSKLGVQRLNKMRDGK